MEAVRTIKLIAATLAFVACMTSMTIIVRTMAETAVSEHRAVKGAGILEKWFSGDPSTEGREPEGALPTTTRAP